MKIINLTGIIILIIGFGLLIFSKFTPIKYLDFIGFTLTLIGLIIFISTKWDILQNIDKRIGIIGSIFVFTTSIYAIINSHKFIDYSIVSLFLLFGYFYYKYVYKNNKMKST